MQEQAIPAAQLQNTIHRQLPTKRASLPGLLELPEIAATVRRWEADDSAFCQALESGLLPVQALGPLGIRLCLAGRNTEAAIVLRAAVSLSPEDVDLLNNLAVALERCTDTSGAITMVNRSLELFSDQPDSWIFLGNLKKNVTDFPAAQSAYETALSLVPDSVVAWQELGMLHMNRREHALAIECFLSCVKHGQVTAEVLAVLGQLFYLTGQFQKSRDAYCLASERDPTNAVYSAMLRETRFVCLAMENADLDEPLSSLSPTEADELLHKTFALVSAYGHTTAARNVAEKRVLFSPASATAAYLLHAVDGSTPVPRSPNDFLVECFDAVAERFDAHLVTGLGYDIPQKLAKSLAALLPTNARLDVLDAGCGTGLCGPWLNAFSKSLVGVDLSPKMLEQARKRQAYDELICAELTSFLQTSPNRFDVIIAADVMIYFGGLTDLASRIASSLRLGGLVAFSTESCSAPGHHLRASGRFLHHPDYVRSIFAHHFVEISFEEATLRQEANQPVAGNLFVFRRA